MTSDLTSKSKAPEFHRDTVFNPQQRPISANTQRSMAEKQTKSVEFKVPSEASLISNKVPTPKETALSSFVNQTKKTFNADLDDDEESNQQKGKKKKKKSSKPASPIDFGMYNEDPTSLTRFKQIDSRSPSVEPLPQGTQVHEPSPKAGEQKKYTEYVMPEETYVHPLMRAHMAK